MARPKAPIGIERKCTRCAATKPVSDYYWYKGTPNSHCKACHSVHNKHMREKHHEKRVADERAAGSGWARSGSREKWKPTEPQKHNGHLLRMYGISLAEYNSLLEAQGFVCAICKDACNRKTTRRLCVDHDHASGLVRGLLCFQCNVGIAKFLEDVKHLKSAIEYLEAFNPPAKCEAA